MTATPTQQERPGSRPASGRSAPEMLPLGLFGIPLGLAGLGAAWSAGRAGLGASLWPEEVLFGASGTFWLAFSVIYLQRGWRRKGAFQADLKHPGGGPFASLIPLVGILLAAHYSEHLPALGKWSLFLFVAALAVVATQLLAHWVTGGVTMQSIHPGYFLPVVAGPFVSSIGFTTVHAPEAATAAFGVGVFFWLVLGTVVTVRLMTGGPLPAPAVPALSAYLAAPATASVAWHVSHPDGAGDLQLALIGVLLMMLLMQVALLGEYRALPFSTLFWVFTFPVATTSNFAIRWFAASTVPGRDIYAWAILTLSTVFVLAIASRTVAGLVRRTGANAQTKDARPATRLKDRGTRVAATTEGISPAAASAASPS